MSLKVFTSTPASLTWREHDSGDRKTGPLHISPLPVKTLKEEKVVYIGGNSLALFSGWKDQWVRLDQPSGHGQAIGNRHQAC